MTAVATTTEKALVKAIRNLSLQDVSFWRVKKFVGSYEDKSLQVIFSGWKDQEAYRAGAMADVMELSVDIPDFWEQVGYAEFFTSLLTYVLMTPTSVLAGAEVVKWEEPVIEV
jgi:hypothetical protein